MNVEEVIAYKCSKCGRTYTDKSVAEKCCSPKHCTKCGTVLPEKSYYYTLCKKCLEEKEKNQEKLRFEKATKVVPETCPDGYMDMIFCEGYGCDEGYFHEIEDLIDYCETANVEIPKYVWGTTSRIIHIDADDIIENACQELHEDACDWIDRESRNELQKFLDDWCLEQTGTLTYEVDYTYAILLNDDEY